MLTDLSMHRSEFKVARPIRSLVALGRLQKLNLAENTLNNEGASALVDAILDPRRSSILQVLRLSHNWISLVGDKNLRS